jgi:F-type H+-transporting ATPase subunit epsilon
MAEHTAITSPGAGLRVVIVTPEQTVLDTTTDFVALPLYDGELGVAPGHAPMIGRLGYGELRIGHLPGVERYYVDGGFVQVAENVVSVLTNRAIPVARLDAGTIQEQIRSTLAQPAAGEDQLARRDRVLAQSRAQLRVALGAGYASH